MISKGRCSVIINFFEQKKAIMVTRPAKCARFSIAFAIIFPTELSKGCVIANKLSDTNVGEYTLIKGVAV